MAGPDRPRIGIFHEDPIVAVRLADALKERNLPPIVLGKDFSDSSWRESRLLVVQGSLRESVSSERPIIILGDTEEDSSEDAIKHLDGGAVGYIAKSEANPRLQESYVARIASRYIEPTLNKIEFGDLVLDLSARSLRKDGEQIQIRKREFDLISYFFRHPEEAVRSIDIYEAVWGPSEYDDSFKQGNLKMHICRVRSLLDFVESKVEIQTFRAFGYRLTIRKEEQETQQMPQEKNRQERQLSSVPRE